MIKGTWQFQYANGTITVPEIDEPNSDSYVLSVLREIAERKHAASSPVGVLYDKAIGRG